MSSDNQWTALGPAEIGFQTHGANIRVGADVVGTVIGAKGRCSGGEGHGVHGIGKGTHHAGVTGTSDTRDGNGVMARAPEGANAFGLWAIGNQGLAAVFEGRVRINGPLEIAGGGKSAVVPLPDGSSVLMYSLECPDSWFEDFGFGRLMDGIAQIEIDENFATAVGHETSYHVFLSEYEGNNGLYVTNRTSTTFEVRSTDSDASGEFSYRIVAKRADIETPRFQKTSIPAKTMADIDTDRESVREP